MMIEMKMYSIFNGVLVGKKVDVGFFGEDIG